MTRTILVVGKTGQLAKALIEEGTPPEFELIAVGRDELDLSRPAASFDLLAAIRPAIVINAAAYTAVDKAESESRLAYAVNMTGPATLAAAAAEFSAGFLHISTDYVFDGGKDGLWDEADPVGPLNVYGASKLAGELAVRAAHPGAIIIRTSWVVSASGNNFVRTMLRLGRARPELKVVADQYGRPTTASSLARAIHAAVPKIARGVGTGAVYHFSNEGPVTNWHGFAEAIFDISAGHGGKRPAVAPIPTSEYPTPARRPANSAMNLTKFQSAFDHTPPTWRDALGEILQELSDAGEIS